MNESLGFLHFLEHTDTVARMVLALLLTGSIMSWCVIAVKAIHLIRTKPQSRRFLQAFKTAPNLQSLAETVNSTNVAEPFSCLVRHGLHAVQQNSSNVQSTDESLIRALRRAIDEQKHASDFGQNLLATIASNTPFLGLLGTVWGIYHALIAIGVSGQSSLDKVAGPVGEALIMTGIGLAVAIPAAIAYNSFAQIQRNCMAHLNSFAYEAHELLTKITKPSAALNDGLSSRINHQGGKQ
jgi:biopolymer transport protein ExbB